MKTKLPGKPSIKQPKKDEDLDFVCEKCGGPIGWLPFSDDEFTHFDGRSDEPIQKDHKPEPGKIAKDAILEVVALIF